jgi:hypothetical protein
MSDIDLSLYVRAPVADVPSAVALGVSLISAMPKEAPAAVKTAGKKLRTSVVALQTAWGAAGAVPLNNKRSADIATDTAWGCGEARLAAYARLPVSHYPKAARAAEIHSALFGEGLAFLNLAFKVQWAEGQKRLDLIKDKGYAADIEELAGHEFWAELKRTHKAYGEALGVTKPEDVAPEVRLSEPLRDVSRAVAAYALQLLAYASDVPKAEASVRKALKPIDDQRAAVARRAAAGGGEEEAAPPAGEPAVSPKTPVPEVPE